MSDAHRERHVMDRWAASLERVTVLEVALEKAIDKLLQLDSFIDGQRKSRPRIRGTVALARAAISSGQRTEKS
jgi:hypothetical protein